MKLLSWLQEPLNEGDTAESGEPPSSPALNARLNELKAKSIREVMIPRALVTALDADVQLRRVRRLKSAKVSYFPVYQGDLDQILGWISKTRVLELLNEPNEDVKLADHVKPIGAVLETDSVAQLADAFLKGACPVLVVRNAQGHTSGIVTLAEFIELVYGFELGPATAPAQSDLTLRSYEI